MSRLLEEHLGAAYNPDVNWTSSLRSKAGFTPFSEDDDLDVSTFTILDTAGQFSGFLARHGFKKAASWRPFPTYHIEVIPSEGNLNERFCVDPAQVYKASLLLSLPSLNAGVHLGLALMAGKTHADCGLGLGMHSR